MKEVQKNCDVFLQNYAMMAKDDFWGHQAIHVAAAGIVMAGGCPLDMERIRYCRKLMKVRESIFSSIRGTGSYVYCVKMALSDDPEQYLEHLSLVHDELHRGLFSTGSDVLAAMNIVDIVPPEQYDVIIRRTRAIYEEMADAHMFLTSEDDMAFAALMAVTGESTEEIHRKAEQIYDILCETLDVHKNTIQTISHILSLYDGDIEAMCNMVVQLYEGLNEAGHPIGKDTSAVVLATFAASRSEVHDLVMDIAAADDYLAQFKPFKGVFGESRKLRRMIAVLCVQRAEGSADTGLSASVAASVTVSLVIRMVMAAAAAA